ncbi:MAG: SpaA isopeptide-forming pilin-related protein [Clostridiales bacterium]|nr:SpaA isopeptide-forming pilin-related protein [Clostridiales bacterium]
MKKLWKNSDGSDMSVEQIPDEIRVQLQRRIKAEEGQQENNYSAVDGYSDIVISPGYVGWNDYIYTLDGLDKYVDYKVAEESRQEYEYRFVELDQNGNVITSGGFLDHYQVTYSESNQDSSSGNFSNTITNTLINKTNIKIIKRDASDETTLLGGVEFKLEKLKEENGIYVVDSTFNALTGTTSSEDGTKGQLQFDELEDGIYRLTETKAADNYSLLKEPITIVLDRVNGCKVDNENWNVDENNTITLTISNRLKFELPATGGYGRTIMILGGLAVAGMALFMYRLQICRKGGRKSRKHL